MIYWQTLAEEHHLTSNDDSERANDNYVGQTKAASVSSYGLSQSVASGIGGGGTMTGSNMGVRTIGNTTSVTLKLIIQVKKRFPRKLLTIYTSICLSS